MTITKQPNCIFFFIKTIYFQNSGKISRGLCRSWGTSWTDWLLLCTQLNNRNLNCYLSWEQLQPPRCDFVGRIMVAPYLLRSSVEHSVKFKGLSVTTGPYELSVYSIIYWSFLINENHKNNLVVFFLNKNCWLPEFWQHLLWTLRIWGTISSDAFLLCTGLKIIILNCYLSWE